MKRSCRVLRPGIVGEYNLRAGMIMDIDEAYVPTLTAQGMVKPLGLGRTANVAPSPVERVRAQPPGIPGIPPGARVLVKLPEVS